MKDLYNIYEDISEGLLSDIDTTLSEGGIITEFADWFVEAFIGDYPKYQKDKTKYLNVFVQCLSTEGNNTIIIDLEKLDDLLDSSFGFFDGTSMFISTPMPSNIKEVKVYNTSNFYINSYIGDISSFNIKVYEDEGNYYGDLRTSFKLKCKDIKFGTIECSELRISSIKAETVYLEKNSLILEIDVSSCNSLKEIYNGESALNNIIQGKYNLTYIKHQLHKAGILPWGSGLTINYMTKNITIK